VQEQCGFEDGELRCIMVEAEPLLRSSLHYRSYDAKSGAIVEGHADIGALRRLQPWGESAP
jgi:nitrite reductase/ring-hydroxylating ferredoxin subunit